MTHEQGPTINERGFTARHHHPDQIGARTREEFTQTDTIPQSTWRPEQARTPREHNPSNYIQRLRVERWLTASNIIDRGGSAEEVFAALEGRPFSTDAPTEIALSGDLLPNVEASVPALPSPSKTH